MNASSQAQRLLREGRLEEALRLYEQILQTSPTDAEALNVVALAALRRGESNRAVSLLETAVNAHPLDFHSRYHLARAYDEAGKVDQAAEDYRISLQARPESYVGRLYLAYALERLGSRESALREYVTALGAAQREGRWLDPSSTPSNLRPLVERAVVLIRDTKRAIANGIFTELRSKYGAAEIGRVERALRVYLREETAESRDPRQRPSFFYFPDLPPSPYPDRKLFPWIEALERETGAIQEELSCALISSSGQERVFLNDALESANLRGTDVKPSWNGHYFYRHGERRDDNCRSCPRTAQAIDHLPLCRVGQHGPEALYSVFTPGTHLLPHRGVTNTRLVGHLPLIIPEDCALAVGGELHEWREGQVVVFDDTYEHEAWNRSAQLRVVLIFDIWNPHLTEIERLAVAEVIARTSELRPSEA